MTAQEQEKMIQTYIDAYNNFDVEGMVALLHPEVVFKNIMGGDITHESVGVDAFREEANKSKGLFSSREQKTSNFMANGNHAKVDIDYTCVLAVDLPEGPKAGESFQIKGRSEFEIVDGKIVQIIDIAGEGGCKKS